MDPTKEQRADLARRIRSERVRQYDTQKDAYVDAGINATTWAKAEAGASLAERSLRRIVRLLWPETGGDWTLLDPPLAGELDLEYQILENALTDESKAYLIALVRGAKATKGKQQRGAV